MSDYPEKWYDDLDDMAVWHGWGADPDMSFMLALYRDHEADLGAVRRAALLSPVISSNRVERYMMRLEALIYEVRRRTAGTLRPANDSYADSP